MVPININNELELTVGVAHMSACPIKGIRRMIWNIYNKMYMVWLLIIL